MTSATFRCCGHCQHGKPSGKYARILDGHVDACLKHGCKGSADPSAWLRLAALLTVFTVRR